MTEEKDPADLVREIDRDIFLLALVGQPLFFAASAGVYFGIGWAAFDLIVDGALTATGPVIGAVSWVSSKALLFWVGRKDAKWEKIIQGQRLARLRRK